MKVEDIAATYTIASATGRLVGDIVGSPALGARIISSVLQAGEQPSEKNIQRRLREKIADGTLQVKGIGPKRLKGLQSALQLGKLLYADVPESGTVIDDPSVAAVLFHEIAWEPVEKFAVLALDIKHRVLSTGVISSGTVSETLACPRDIFRWLIQVGGTRCILAHNHPSTSLEPSPEDIQLTRQLLAASKTLGLPILDHLIVSGERWASIRQTTELWAERT